MTIAKRLGYAGIALLVLFTAARWLSAPIAPSQRVQTNVVVSEQATATPTPMAVGDWKTFVKPDKATLRAHLTPLQYQVTQEDGTETPFQNEYWNNEGHDGIYVDIVSGEPLFSSKDMFDSGTGWPSFTKPLVKENIVEQTDYKLLVPRTEVRSKHAGSHLGHVFTDGPAPLGLRYCMNSAALRFIPADRLVAEGYPEYAASFNTVQ